jgi:hypothetical protein
MRLKHWNAPLHLVEAEVLIGPPLYVSYYLLDCFLIEEIRVNILGVKDKVLQSKKFYN